MPHLRFELARDVASVMPQVEAIEAFLIEAGCNPASATQMAIVAEEILTNIARDAWPASAPGVCVVDVEAEPAEAIRAEPAEAIRAEPVAAALWVRLRTDDDGVAFDPTQAENPDIEASLEDRAIGGLGILLVREMTDTQVYERTDGHNILTVSKLCPLA